MKLQERPSPTPYSRLQLHCLQMGDFHLYFSRAPIRASLNLPSVHWESHSPPSFCSDASEAWVLTDGRAEKRGVGWGCMVFLC